MVWGEGEPKSVFGVAGDFAGNFATLGNGVKEWMKEWNEWIKLMEERIENGELKMGARPWVPLGQRVIYICVQRCWFERRRRRKKRGVSQQEEGREEGAEEKGDGLVDDGGAHFVQGAEEVPQGPVGERDVALEARPPAPVEPCPPPPADGEIVPHRHLGHLAHPKE